MRWLFDILSALIFSNTREFPVFEQRHEYGTVIYKTTFNGLGSGVFWSGNSQKYLFSTDRKMFILKKFQMIFSVAIYTTYRGGRHWR
jgi:hypothetical protein